MIRLGLTAILIFLTFSVKAEGVIDGWVRVHGHVFPLHPVTVRVFDAETGVELEQLRTENNTDGTYEITGVPNGDYKVLYDAHSESERYLDKLAGNRLCDNGGCEITEIGAVITVQDDTRTLNINLLEGGTLGGRVTNDRRRPLPGAIVEFYDEHGEPVCCSRVADENGEWTRPVFFPAKYYVVSRFDEPSEYRPQVYPRRNCSGCDVVEVGTPITFNYIAQFLSIDARLESFGPNPDVNIESFSRAKYSGSWFNPDRDGEGFIFEVLDRPGPGGEGFEVVVFWFTYTPDGQQAWMVGTGSVAGRRAQVDLQIFRGASFGDRFDPDDVIREFWGSIDFEFLNCGEAHAQYAGEYGSGQIDLVRLSSINGLGCADTVDASVEGNSVFSGAWFNPLRDGEGFILEVVGENSVLAYWFTYDLEGNQMWMLGLGELDDLGQATITMQRSSGGNFGDRFNPATILLQDWGQVSLQMGECNAAAYTWSAPEPFGAGAYELSRLTMLRRAGC